MNRITCDQCRRNLSQPKPSHLIRVIGETLQEPEWKGAPGVLDEELHFCTLKCLVDWANTTAVLYFERP